MRKLTSLLLLVTGLMAIFVGIVGADSVPGEPVPPCEPETGPSGG